MDKTKTGEIHEKNSLFLRAGVGKATDKESKITYELSTQYGASFPIVCSEKTGKYFTLSWKDIINLAVNAGIDK